MMDVFYKIFMSEEVLILFLKKKKNQIWSKNPKISFRQFKMTLAEGGYRFKRSKTNKTKQNVY